VDLFLDLDRFVDLFLDLDRFVDLFLDLDRFVDLFLDLDRFVDFFLAILDFERLDFTLRFTDLDLVSVRFRPEPRLPVRFILV
jgi:hypothetical protein